VSTDTFDTSRAFDEAFAGQVVHLVEQRGRSERFDVAPCSGEPDWVDQTLFIKPCTGPTIDIGCGPSRLVAALAHRAIRAIGVDVSREAVKQTRGRGAWALRRDVFSTVPDEGLWEHALLADGNLGIGGDPVRLLRRVRDVVKPDGQIIVEVDSYGTGIVRSERSLQAVGRTTPAFIWTVVGLDAIGSVAAMARLVVVATQSVGGRHTATLARRDR